MYALGVPAFCGLQVLTRLYYSLEEVRTPVAVGALMVLVNLALNLALVGPMKEAGLALVTSLSAGLNLLLLAVLARKKLGIRGLRGVLASLLRSLALAAAMGVAVFFLSAILVEHFPDRGLVAKLLWVLPPVLAGMILFGGAAVALRLPEARELLPRLRR